MLEWSKDRGGDRERTDMCHELHFHNATSEQSNL
jgi:hypothetical protein